MTRPTAGQCRDRELQHRALPSRDPRERLRPDPPVGRGDRRRRRLHRRQRGGRPCVRRPDPVARTTARRAGSGPSGRDRPRQPGSTSRASTPTTSGIPMPSRCRSTWRPGTLRAASSSATGSPSTIPTTPTCRCSAPRPTSCSPIPASRSSPGGSTASSRWSTGWPALRRRSSRAVCDAVGTVCMTPNGVQDYDYYLRIARSYPITFHRAKLARWRFRPDSQSGDVNERALRWTSMSVQVLARRACGGHPGDAGVRRRRLSRACAARHGCRPRLAPPRRAPGPRRPGHALPQRGLAPQRHRDARCAGAATARGPCGHPRRRGRRRAPSNGVRDRLR